MSANPREAQVDSARLAQAIDWLTRLRHETISDEEVEAWISWCQKDPLNQQAFESIQALWGDFGRMPEDVKSKQANREPTSVRDKAVGWFTAMPAPRVLATAATAALVAIAAVVTWEMEGTRRTGLAKSVQAPAARNEEAVLPDGSSVALGARSAVDIQFAGEKRSVRMSDGQAYFRVAPDPRRPFVVTAGAVRVQAVGTAFDVRKNNDRVVVTVTEGKVQVSTAPSPTSSGAITLGSGFQLVWDGSPDRVSLSQVDAAMATAWRDGRLEYLGEPLKTVIANVNRYSQRRIVIDDDEVGRIVFTGSIFVDSIDDWLLALERAFSLARVERPDGGLTLAPRPIQARSITSQ